MSNIHKLIWEKCQQGYNLDEFYSAEDIARKLKVDVRTVNHWANWRVNPMPVAAKNSMNGYYWPDVIKWFRLYSPPQKRGY